MTKLGLSLEQIVYAQIFLFSLALMTLLAALLRAGVSGVLVLLVTIALAANGYFSSFQRTIMSEFIYFSGHGADGGVLDRLSADGADHLLGGDRVGHRLVDRDLPGRHPARANALRRRSG